jgi:cytochrome c oxidase subunit 2
MRFGSTAKFPYKHMYFDLPEPWQLTFQDPASPIMEGIISLHNWILFYLIIISLFVLYFILIIMSKFSIIKHPLGLRTLKDGTSIEIIWTITPALILITIAFPSFKLLYLMDEVIDPTITIKAIGHQWYWEYEYTDYIKPSVKFESYMVPTDDLTVGQTRILEVDNEVVLPTLTSIRVIVTATDVLHAWTVPSLGVKLDCVPGRLNQTGLYIKRNGIYYGQCSELCGVQHGFMPIVIKSVSISDYIDWLKSYEAS